MAAGGLGLRTRKVTGSLLLLAMAVSVLLGVPAAPAAAVEDPSATLTVTPADGLLRAVPVDVAVTGDSFPAGGDVEVAYCAGVGESENCHGQQTVPADGDGHFATSLLIDYQYISPTGCAENPCFVSASVGGTTLVTHAITFSSGPELGVSPSTRLDPTAPVTVFVRGVDLQPFAPATLTQCAGPVAALVCSSNDQGGTVAPDGDLVQDGMQVSNSTDAFTECPEGECFVRAAESQPYTATLGNMSGLAVETRCAPGEQVTGVRADIDVPGFSDFFVSRIAPVCGETEGAFIGQAVGPAPDEYSSCPSDQVVTGISGREGDAVDAIAVRCHALDANDLPTGLETFGDQVGGTGGTPINPGPSCPAGTVAIGLHGIELQGFGDPIYEIGLICDHLPTEPFELLAPISFYADLAVENLVVDESEPTGWFAPTIPTADIPASTIPASSVPLIGSTPLRSIDIEASPLRSIPLRSIPLRSIPLRSIPLRSIMLSSIPLRSIGWATILEGTPLEDVPLQTVSLEDVLDDDTARQRFEALDLATVDLSATPLRSISVVSLALGATPLRSIPLRSIEAGETPDNYAEWCTWLAGLDEPISCQDEGFTADSPIMALDLAGVPLRSIPLRSIPLRSIDLEASPLRSIPLRSIAISNTPLRSIPLRSIDMAATPLRSIPLRSIDIASTPLRSIPLRSINAAFLGSLLDCTQVDCTSETLTLGDVFTAVPGDATATLGELLAALAADAHAGTLGGLFNGLPADADAGTLGELIAAVIANPDVDLGTLGEILLGLVLAGDYPWEELPLVKMGAHRYTDNPYLMDFDIRYDASGGQATSVHTITAKLPPGFAFDPGSTTLYSPTLSGFWSDWEPLAPTITGDPVLGETLTWTLPDMERDQSWDLYFGAHAGPRIGTAGPVEVTVVADDGVSDDSATASSGDVGTHLPAGQLATGTIDFPRPAELDTLMFGYIRNPEEVDYFEIDAPEPGTRLSVRLSHLSADADLVLYGPAGAANEDVPSAAPLRSIPLRSIPLEDESLTGEAVPPETLQDIPLRSIPLRSISANRSDADEEIDITSTALNGKYTIQVSGYNGATSDEPYVLHVRAYDPPPAPTCTTTVDLTGTTPGTPSADNPDAETLILLNEQRLHALHPNDAAAVRTSLDNLAADENVNGVVLPVDSDSDVAAAYSAWDAAACSPEKANAVVNEITSLVSTFAQDHDQLRSVVLVGGDDLLPMARLDDTTSLSNERDYAGDTAGPNPLTGAFATEHILSDDPYGDLDPIAWLNRRLHVPDLAVGRLVEAPAEIIGQVEQFIAADGQLDPQTALTTGYDFLTDGAQAVTDELETALPLTGVQSLISEDWTTGDVTQQLFGSGDAPDIASINAHYDHYRALPADQNAAGTETDLFTVADIPTATGATSTLAGRILFTMGCHAGLSVPDRYVAAGGPAQDWAQTFSAQRAIYVANTGFGYGDTAAVALSERLMALFAGELGQSESVGAALAAAKSEYFASMGVYGSYDEKAMAEATFYGLPMYRIGPETMTASDADGQVSTASTSETEAVTLTPTFTSATGERGRFWSVDGDVQVTHYRPIQPRTSVDITRAGQVAHGAVIEDLRSADIAGVDPVFARPTVDLAEHEPEIESADVVFPTSLHTISTVGLGADQKQRLVVMPGQFFGLGDGDTSGVQRLFTRVDATVLYGTGDEEFDAPTIEQIHATSSGGTAQFSVEARDPAGVERVLVLFRDTTNTWTPVELALSGGAWTGTASAASDAIEYFVQAVDAFGNVAQSTNKGRYFHAFAGSGGEPVPGPDPAGDLVVEYDGSQGDEGWWSSDVTLTPTGAAFYRLDDGDWLPLATGEEVLVTAEGTTRVVFGDADQNPRGTHLIKIDREGPTIAGTTPSEGGVYATGAAILADYTCSDALSGVKTCTQPTALDTAVEGAYSHTIVATDKAGNTTELTVQYVVENPLTFHGFRSPVDNTKTNVVKAGAAVPLKWALQYDDGTYERSTEGITWRSVAIDCLSLADDAVEETVVASESGVKYDTQAEQYVLTWKTLKTWDGCRKFILDIPDHGEQTVLFQFR